MASGSLPATVAEETAAVLRRERNVSISGASHALSWTVVSRGVVDGIKTVIRQTRTPEKGTPRRPDGTRPRLRRTGAPLDGRNGSGRADRSSAGNAAGRASRDYEPY